MCTRDPDSIINNISSYDVVLDVRPASKYLAEHLPGALNGPLMTTTEQQVVDEIANTNAWKAKVLADDFAGRNVWSHIVKMVNVLKPGSQVLIYGDDWGDPCVEIWKRALVDSGVMITVLEGGFTRYQQWVEATLRCLIPKFKYHVISGSTGVGKTDMLQALAETGHQTIDAEALIRQHRDTSHLESNTLVKSALVWQMLRFDRSKPVWMECTGVLMQEWLPADLLNALSQPERLCILSAPMPERVRTFVRKHRDTLDHPEVLVQRIHESNHALSDETVSGWQELAKSNDVDELAAGLLGAHYDVRHTQQLQKMRAGVNEVVKIAMSRLDPPDFARAARALAAA